MNINDLIDLCKRYDFRIMTFERASVLILLYTGPKTYKEISDRLNIVGPRLYANSHWLKSEGYIDSTHIDGRNVHHHKGECQRYSLTEKGKKYVKELLNEY